MLADTESEAVAGQWENAIDATEAPFMNDEVQISGSSFDARLPLPMRPKVGVIRVPSVHIAINPLYTLEENSTAAEGRQRHATSIPVALFLEHTKERKRVQAIKYEWAVYVVLCRVCYLFLSLMFLFAFSQSARHKLGHALKTKHVESPRVSGTFFFIFIVFGVC